MVRSGCWCAPTPPPLALADGVRAGNMNQLPGSIRDTSLMPRLNDTGKAPLRSQSGPLSGAALSTAPTCFHTRIESHLFRLLLFRRLRLPLPPCVFPSVVVAALWTPLATIEQRVHGRVCLRDVASWWRWPQPRCAGKLVHGSPTSWSVTWTLVSHIQHWTVEDSRLWQKAFLSLGGGAARP